MLSFVTADLSVELYVNLFTAPGSGELSGFSKRPRGPDAAKLNIGQKEVVD